MSLATHFDLVILDWAGTMVDFGCRAPVKALVEAFKRHGVSLSASQARRDMGKAKADHVAALLNDSDIIRAWTDANGAKPTARDRDALIADLGPLMREQAAQGYVPDHLVCSGETLHGRPSPLMIYKACVDLAMWPLSRVVKVDDSESGVAEGRAGRALRAAGADLVIDSVAKLVPTLEEYAARLPAR